jgi:phosphoribosylaminoimidazolecarboxamide formyltransferase/IMP cyclohydrolase
MGESKLALLSVSDKRGIETLARGLTDLGFEILSTGGTSAAIRAAGVNVVKISDHTGAPEIMEGRVKTLHPKIHGGILARDKADHLADLERIGAALIDVVVVNLYPFERTAASPVALLPEVVEQIDIGGPCLLRAAAKTFERVTVVCDPGDYEIVLWHLAKEGQVPEALRFELAVKAFKHTAAYDAAISKSLPGYDLGSGRKRGGAR